ncbi:MAG: PQQ-dependent sugar dehydrogenase [Actinomycetota bacterium]
MTSTTRAQSTRLACMAAPAAMLLLVVPVAAPAQETITARTVVEGLEFPAGIAFASDGTMFVTERTGRIRVVRGGRLLARPLAEIATTTEGETGLLGVAVSPDDRFVYAFATAPDGGSNRVYRVPTSGGEPQVVVDGLPASVYHNGGGVAFDEDGMLLVSNGEQHDSSKAQDPQVLGGKVYRFTPTGGVPPDNPFGGSPALAIGLRNPYGLTVDPVSGNAFVTENGPDSFDEVDRIVEGGNYGWPEVSGPAPDPAATRSLTGAYQDPLLDYPEIVVPVGIAFAHPREARAGFEGDLFFATYGEQAIHRVGLDRSRSRALSDDVFLRSDEPLVALAWGPEGLYYSTGASPGAVRVIPLAAPEGDARPPRQPRDDEGNRDEPTPSDEPTAAQEPGAGDPGPGGVLLVAAAAAVTLGLLAFAFRRRRP